MLALLQQLFESMFPLLKSVPVIQAILGFILVFILPGFAWTLVFFSTKQINLIERIALSLGLSIALVTLSLLLSDRLIGIKITGFNSVLIIITITVIPILWYCLKRLAERQRSRK